MKNIKLGDYIEILTDYHSGGSYKTLKENTKILYKPDYAVMIRTLNFERDDFKNDLIYCDKQSYNFLKYSHVNENDILMNKIANPGSVYIMPHTNYKCTCGMNLFLIRFKNINQRYMYYVMKNSEEYIKSKAHGTTTKTITKDEVRNLEFKIHDTIDEQNKVERFLTYIDNKIDNNNQINNNLEELMKTLYQRWFIEFEFPNEDGKPYKSSGGEFIYSEDLKQNIPQKWNVENCFKNKLYEIIKPGLKNFERKNYLATGNVSENMITDGEWITYENRESRANMQPIKNSIWFAKMKNSIKHLTLPEKSEWFINKYILSTGFLGIRCISNSLSYLHCFIYSNYFEKVKDMLAHGATQESINNEDLKAIKLLIPDNTILERFENETKSIIQKQLEIEHENQRLIELKKFLLPLLMNGQINVDNIEI